MNLEKRSPAPADDTASAWRVREAHAGDVPLIASFNLAMARETEALELAEATVHDGVAAVVADPALGFYLVAESAGEVAGALLVTREWSDWRNACFWWIQSVYVVPAARGRGAYRGLHAEVRRRARAACVVCGVRLYVAKNNQVAKQTYAALGMRELGYAIFEEALENP